VQSISQQDAVNFVNTWLQAKRRLFAYPYDQQLGAELTTGKAYRDKIRGPNSNGEPESSLEWLRNRNFYYTYGLQRIDSVERFEQYNNEAVIEVIITEQRTMYGKNGKVVKENSRLDTTLIRYILRLENGKLKLSDINTVRRIS
jgi:serine/threonine-protein kinase